MRLLSKGYVRVDLIGLSQMGTLTSNLEEKITYLGMEWDEIAFRILALFLMSTGDQLVWAAASRW